MRASFANLAAVKTGRWRWFIHLDMPKDIMEDIPFAVSEGGMWSMTKDFNLRMTFEYP